MEQWLVAAKKADFNGIAKRFGIDPVIARIMRNRDLVTEQEMEDYLNGSLEQLSDPFLLKDMDKAAAILGQLEKEKIRIIGDYDIDGVCSTYILCRGLARMGLQADTAIPHRVQDGYGLNERLVQEAIDDGIKVLITCDNGIAAASQIQLAKEHGLTVIVTDHHEVPYELNAQGEKEYLLPPADAVIDPKQADCSYPFPEICGGYVAYQVIRAFMQAKGMQDAELSEELLEIAAFATIGDVMELRNENRILVKHGLKALARTKNLGMRALIAVCGLEGKALSPYHVGFVLGPCMNATGRLDTAARALELLESTDYARALELAQELQGLNESRKDLTLKGLAEAQGLVEQLDPVETPVFVLQLKNCHESLAGIIAGRIRERYNHPVIVLTETEEGIKGSGRSIEAYSMYEEISKCKELLTKYGGHKMAAGLSLAAENVEEFGRRLNQECTLTEKDFVKVIHIDVPMPMSYVTMDFVKQLSVLEPFGTGNPKPVFAQKDLLFLSARILGKNNRVMKFTCMDHQKKRYALTLFSEHEPFDDYIEEKFGARELAQLYAGRSTGISLSVVYYPDINEYQGKTELQFVISSYR